MKEAYYFSHDSNARHDPKILSMRSVYGSEGYGWYWIVIEMLREQDDFQIELTKYVWNALAMQAQCTADAMHNFVQDCINEFRLFNTDGDFFWSDSLKRRMEIRNDKSEKARKAAEARWGKSSKDNVSTVVEQKQSTSNADAMQTHSDRNAIKEKKVKEIKVNKNKVNNKTQYAEFVSMKPEEYQKLVEEHGQALTQKMIEVLDNYKGSNGKKYKDDYRAILNWVKDRVLNNNNKPTRYSKSTKQEVLPDWFDEAKSQLNQPAPTTDVTDIESKKKEIESMLKVFDGNG